VALNWKMIQSVPPYDIFKKIMRSATVKDAKGRSVGIHKSPPAWSVLIQSRKRDVEAIAGWLPREDGELAASLSIIFGMAVQSLRYLASKPRVFALAELQRNDAEGR
jgi:hypothetical protein